MMEGQPMIHARVYLTTKFPPAVDWNSWILQQEGVFFSAHLSWRAKSRQVLWNYVAGVQVVWVLRPAALVGIRAISRLVATPY